MDVDGYTEEALKKERDAAKEEEGGYTEEDPLFSWGKEGREQLRKAREALKKERDAAKEEELAALVAMEKKAAEKGRLLDYSFTGPLQMKMRKGNFRHHRPSKPDDDDEDDDEEKDDDEDDEEKDEEEKEFEYTQVTNEEFSQLINGTKPEQEEAIKIATMNTRRIPELITREGFDDLMDKNRVLAFRLAKIDPRPMPLTDSKFSSIAEDNVELASRIVKFKEQNRPQGQGALEMARYNKALKKYRNQTMTAIGGGKKRRRKTMRKGKSKGKKLKRKRKKN